MEHAGTTRTFGHGALHRWLGLELGARTPAWAETSLCVRPEFLQEEDVVQGGILTALADATAVYLLMSELVAGESMTSVEFKLNFLAPARICGGPLAGRAELLRGGRTLAVCRSSVRQADVVVATGLFTYVFRRGKG